MATIRSLYVALKASTDDYNKKIRDANQLAKDFDKTLRPTRQLLSDIGTTAAVAGAVVGGALVALAKKAADYGDEMLEASQKTGIGTQQLSALRLVAESSGSSFEGMTSAVSKLSKGVFEAATKGGDAAKTFSALGISIKDSSGHLRQASDILPEIADRFANMKDGTEKTALAIKLFGKAGADLIPTLNQGAEGFRRASEMVKKYNVDIGDAGNKLGDDFNDTVKETGLAMQGLANQIGVALLPAMTRIVEIANNVIAKLSAWAKEHPGLTKAIAGTSAALVGGGGLLMGISAFMSIAPGLIGNIKLIGAAFMGLSVPMKVILVALTVLTAAFLAFPKIRGPIIETFAVLNQVLFAWVDGLGRVTGILVRLVKGEWTAAWETLKSLPDQVAESWVARGDMVRNFAKDIGDGIKGMNAALKTTPADMPDFKGMGVDLDAFADSAKKSKDAVQSLYESMRSALTPADELDEDLTQLQKLHFSNAEIVAVYGDRIIEAADKQQDYGLALSNNIKTLRDMAIAVKNNAVGQAALNQVWDETIAKMAKEREALTAPFEVTVKNGGMTEQLETLKKIGQQKIFVDDLKDSLNKQQDQLRSTAAAMVQLGRDGYSTAQIESMLGMRLEDVAKRAKELGIQLDPVTKKTLEQKAAAEKLRVGWGETFAAMSDKLVDMIVDFDFSFKRLKDIGLSTAKDLATSFLDGFFKPFKDELQHLGEAAGKWASGLLFGTSGVGGAQPQQGGAGGLLGGLLGGPGGGGILGGLFGGGENSVWNEKIGGFGGGSGGGGLGSMLGGIGGGGYAQAAAQAFDTGYKIVAGGWKPGQQAQNVASNLENKLMESLVSILDDSSLTGTMKTKLIESLWAGAQAQIAEISAVDKNFAKAGTGALASVTPYFTNALKDLAPWVEREAQEKATAEKESAPAGTTITVEKIENHFHLEGVTDPATFIDWMKRNVSGMTEEMVNQVQLRWDAVVSH